MINNPGNIFFYPDTVFSKITGNRLWVVNTKCEYKLLYSIFITNKVNKVGNHLIQK